MINLILLGCGENMPMPNRFSSSLFINFKGRKIIIDYSEGTQVSIRMKNCGFKTIDFICITHLHGDHIIVFLLNLKLCKTFNYNKIGTFLYLSIEKFFTKILKLINNIQAYI